MGGEFTHASGNAANHIALWDGSAWLGIGGGTNGTVRALDAGNDYLYVGGDLTTQAGIQ